MKNLKKKLEHIKWIKSMGIDYYYSDEIKSENNLLLEIKKLSEKSKKNNFDNERPKTNNHFNLIANISDNSMKIKKTVKKSYDANNKEQTKEEQEAKRLSDQSNTIEELKQAVENFEYCDLKKFATKTVFADGNPSAKILLIGEAPGAKEDEQGIPFCGESGILLDKMLASIGISREKNLYITNTVFWRPPANRKPTKEEINICKPFVEKHISLIEPEIIILVGETAIKSVLGITEPVTKVRQNHYVYTNQYCKKEIYTTALFHPAYLLRQPSRKKDTWQDLLKIQDFMNNLPSKT